MLHPLKTLKLGIISLAVFSSISFTNAGQGASRVPHPNRTEGVAFGFGLGVKLLNLKSIITQTKTTGVVNRSHDGMSNRSSPTVSLYARKYTPDLLWIPTFWGLEFDYLIDLKKTDTFAKFINNGQKPDTGYSYREYWNARAMVGGQVWSWAQVDLWAQAGLQVTYFRFEGITKETPTGQPQVFKMGNKLRAALSPAGGLEVRHSVPCLFSNSRVVTDFIVGWTASYRSAISHPVTASSGDKYDFTLSSNWSHLFGLKVLFRY